MTIVDAIGTAAERLCLMLGIGLDRSAIDEILSPVAEDIQLAYTHWVAFS
ncbi:hypothetical protein [Nocardia thailandica]|nr:hypothetical protein [Nocardia thailandica]